MPQILTISLVIVIMVIANEEGCVVKTALPEVPRQGTEKAARAIWEALAFLAASWGFSGSEIARLIHSRPTTVNGWLANHRVPIGSPPFTPDHEALLHLLAIHRSLDAMFSTPKHQVAWLKTKHPDLGVIPLERIKQSMEGLIFIRQYLDYIRGRGA